MTTYFQRLEGENQQIQGAGRDTGGTDELNLEHTTCLNVFTLLDSVTSTVCLIFNNMHLLI